jgi:hypothetical protein
MYKEDIEKFTVEYIGLVKEDGFEEKAIMLQERCKAQLDRHNNSPKEYLNISAADYAVKHDSEQREIVKTHKKEILIEAGKHCYARAHEDIWQLENQPDKNITVSQEKMIDILDDSNNRPGGGGSREKPAKELDPPPPESPNNPPSKEKPKHTPDQQSKRQEFLAQMKQATQKSKTHEKERD